MRSVTSFPRYRHEARWTIACGHCSLKMSCALIAGKREAAQLQSDKEDAALTSHSKLNVQSCHDATPSLRPLANLQARGMQHVQILQQHSLQDSDADIWTILGKFLAAGVSLSVSEHLTSKDVWNWIIIRYGLAHVIVGLNVFTALSGCRADGFWMHGAGSPRTPDWPGTWNQNNLAISLSQRRAYHSLPFTWSN